jgi:hypothetical protein
MDLYLKKGRNITTDYFFTPVKVAEKYEYLPASFRTTRTAVLIVGIGRVLLWGIF